MSCEVNYQSRGRNKNNFAEINAGRGTQYKRPYIDGDMPPTWVAKSASWYMNGSIFQIFPNLSQNWLKFKKILEKLGDFAQNLAQNWGDWYMNGSLFFLFFFFKLVFVWIYFQILQ